MKLLALSVEHFRCIRKATVRFGVGLNVLHGPNDLGKSSLVSAIRAALLLQVSSKEAEDFVNWHGSGEPHVELTFESEPQRIWQIKKTFGSHAQAFLYESRDGVDFHVEARGREVDGRLSEILRWGLAPPGGRTRPRGMPVTFLSSALLAEQDQVAAIFGQALSSDSDESGKKRLIEVLQAAAEDPIFKSILNVVQAKVEEAFAASGQRRRGKDSPWIKIQEQIQRATEEERHCIDQLQKTESIESELQQLLALQFDCKTTLDSLTEEQRSAQQDYDRAAQRAAIQVRRQECQKRLDQITAAVQKLAETRLRHAELVQMVASLARQELDAKAKVNESAARLKSVAEALRLRSADRDRERQLRQSTLQKDCAELRSQQAFNEAALGRVGAIEKLAERERALRSGADDLSRKVTELTVEHQVAQLIRSIAAKAAISEADNALAQIETWRRQADQYRDTAVKVEGSLNQNSLPEVAGIDALNRLEQQLQVTRAKLGVGLHLVVRPRREMRLSIRRDGGEPETSVLKEGEVSAHATNEIQLDIEDVAEISLSGGQDSVREELARLQMQWNTEAKPVLRQAGLASLEELSEAVKARATSLDEIRKYRLEAATLDQRISDQPNWETLRADRQRELDPSERALLGADRTKLAKLVAKANPAKVRARAQEGDLTAAKALHAEKQKDLAAVQQDLFAARSSIDGYSEGLLAELLAKQTQLASGLQAAEFTLESLEASIDEGLAEARAPVDQAEEEHAAAEARCVEIAGKSRETNAERASAEGELRILTEAAEKLNESAARLELLSIEAELSLVPVPERAVTEELFRLVASQCQGERNGAERHRECDSIETRCAATCRGSSG